MSATLRDFAAVSDRVAGTTKKLEKQKLIGEYLRAIDADDDLRRAVRYAGGYAFPATTEHVLGVSGAIVSDAILSLIPVEPRVYGELVVKRGEIGEALSVLWEQFTPGQSEEALLTLLEIDETFEDLARTGNQAIKRELLRNLFARCQTNREAAYLAKIIFGDLRTGVQEGVLAAALAEAFAGPYVAATASSRSAPANSRSRLRKEDATEPTITPLQVVQRAALLVGDLDEVAVLAKHGKLDDAKFKLFHPLQFMLATPQETAADAVATMATRTFFAEDKLDGIRAQVHKEGDRIAIYTRTMDRTDESFPDVVKLIAQIPGDVLLDGEIVPFRDGQVLPFAHIQKRLGRKLVTSKTLRDHPAVFMAFDLLYLNGELLMDKPLRERRAALETVAVEKTIAMELSSLEQIEAAFAAARDNRNEGLMLKDPDSPYAPGRRGKQWLKLKTHLPTLDCVVTAAEYGHGKRRNSLSDYTFAVWDGGPGDAGKLVNIGKAFSGVTDAEIAQLTELFLSIAVNPTGRVRMVPPKVVLEIACDQIQKSARHASGFALRFPRIKRVRWDKRPEDADTLARVKEIFESTHNFGRGDEKEPIREPTLFDGL
jgi:DNA ligase-1